MSTVLVTGPPIALKCVSELEDLGFDVINGTSAAFDRLGTSPTDRSRDLTEGEMVMLIAEAAFYIYGGLEVASSAVLGAARELRLIAFLGTSWADKDCIDAAAAAALRTRVSNTPGANAASVAEATMTLLLALQKQLVELNNQSKRGVGRPIRLKDIAGRRLGIVGMGQIGSRVARHAVQGFQMEVMYCGPNAKPDLERELGIQRVELRELLRKSDFVSLHSPARTTTGLIGASQLKLMQRTAFLLNLSSPELVDGPALVAALQGGQIAGAGFDGWFKEPLALREAFLALEDSKLIVLPRSAWLTDDSYGRMTSMAMNNIRAVIQGGHPPNQVNPQE